MLAFSAIVGAALIALNLTLLASVHALGSNELPPEISRVCLSLDLDKRQIRPHLRPSALPWTLSADPLMLCKPLWEHTVLPSPSANDHSRLPWTTASGVGWNTWRVASGPWQVRVEFPLTRSILAVSTRLVSNYTDRLSPEHTLLYDFALFTDSVPINGEEGTDTGRCRSGPESGWLFVEEMTPLSLPYFTACEWSILVSRRVNMVKCRDEPEERDIATNSTSSKLA
jgi:hypothetical protein